MTGQNPEKSEVAKREEETLKFWRENKIFEKSLAKPSPKGEFVFYDGPPFATGLPHYGHLLTSIVKDVIPRYKTMQGYHVRRRWGWDTHGLPIENMIEKELGFKSKKDIEEIGVEKFNEACRAKVLEYANEWKKYVDRIGRWVDFDDAYMTMDATYTESVWWTLKEIYNKGLLYEGRKVLMYCPHCETPLSKAEIAMDNSYKDITEDAVLVEFGLTSDPKTSLLAWTTTPWTLPANVALAVHPEITYVTVEKKDMGNGELVRFVLAKERLENVFGAEEYKIVEERKGSELVGLEYTALFDVPKMASDKSYKVYAADFVNTYEGTGVVHTAVIYGEDDYQLGLKNDLPMVPLLNPNGTYNTDAPEFLQGQYIKKVDKMVIEDLEKRGFLFDKKANTHSYPHCYRCDTPLIYNALSSWFINIQKIKARMIELNEKINWVPEHLKHGRFLNIVENAPDWGISRNRYWASPLPIWKCSSCQDIKVVGSLEELRSKVTKSGNKYFLMRHGHSKGNPQKLVSIQGDENDFLTEEGKEQVRKSGEDLKSQNIDLIVHSPFTRIKESVNIVADILGLPKENVLGDERLHEFDARKFAGRPWSELWASEKDMDLYVSPGGAEESYALVRTRMIAALVDLESKYKGQNILIVSHDLPLLLLSAGHNALSHSDEVCNYESMPYFKNAEVREFNFLPLPRNMRGEIDLHRPYIDAIKLKCDCGGIMSRVPEVVDCWV
ncbi:MAG TPA: class I tRNA ligase family protein [Candidatus Paceibacterota bacterium]